MENNFEIDPKKIDLLAQLAVHTGLGLQSGQNLLITAPIESLPLVRRLSIHAYRAGAGLVTPLFSDPEITLARFQNANNDSFDKAADWLYNGMGEAFDGNTARLAVAGDDPMLLADEDPEKVGRVNKATSIAYKPARERITRFDINWNIISWPGTAWAKRMFPELTDYEARKKLSDAIFAASRVDQEDPMGAWSMHNVALKEKSEFPDGVGLYLNKNSFAVNEVSPDSKTPSKLVSIRSRLSRSNKVKVLVFGPTETLNDSSATIV